MVETAVIKSSSMSKLTGNGNVNTEPVDATAGVDDHYNPSVRILHIPKQTNGSCGFHLSRSKWDPYPWVSIGGCLLLLRCINEFLEKQIKF